ncbi:MAG: hypothetical protein QOG25_1459 [Acetobacteraceae bacterium]|jgi:uncharacterized protein (UPF0335 family)|nr:hypothetical protein [Acetobacteraceae bacterium]
MGLSSIGQLFAFARETQDLFALQAKMKEGLVAMDGRLRSVEDRLTRLETEQGQVITEARSAATAAAAMIASAVIADAVTRVTRLEEGIRRLGPDLALLPWRNGTAA